MAYSGEMAPYLLLGFFIAGLLHAFVPQPLCSCGVIPTAVSMRKEGASKGA